MDIGFSAKLQMASAGLALALASSGCSMMEPKAERYVAPPLGATWVTARRDSGSFGSGNVQLPGKRGERMWQGTQVVTFEGPEGAILALPDGGWLGIVSGDRPLITWDPPLTWDYPLEVGKTWVKDYRMTMHAASQTIPFQVTQKVEAYENLTVPAGTFKVFRISTSSTLGEENMHWFSPELGIFAKSINTRTAKHPAGPGKRETEIVSQTITK